MFEDDLEAVFLVPLLARRVDPANPKQTGRRGSNFRSL
jgi:hypothetical protein